MVKPDTGFGSARSGIYACVERMFRLLLFVFLLTGILLVPHPVFADPILTVTPITWNIIGLDSNSPADAINTPNLFPVGVRVCNSNTGTVGTNITASLVWDSANPYINIRPGTSDTLTYPSLNPGQCTDFYFEVEVTRTAAAFNTTRRYHIEVTSTDAPGQVFSSPVPRELFVERLISQSRNSVTNIRVSSDGASYTNVANGGTMTLYVGNTYWIQLIGDTATSGYEQIESFINFPNTVFRIDSVDTTYSAGASPTDRLYNDPCVWDNDPNSPNYRSCLSTGKAGGSFTTTYQVTILSTSSTNPQPLNTLVYDFSGSSFHYNSDFGVTARYAAIVDPSAVSIEKEFSPDTIGVNGVSALTITLSNPNPAAISGVSFEDPFPANLVVANPPSATATGCGTPTLVATAGASSISFSNGTLGANSSCVIRVNVTASAIGSVTNTTNALFVGSLNTGHTATAALTVNTTPASPAPTCGWTMAQWTFAGLTGGADPLVTANYYQGDVGTPSISVGGTNPGTLTAETDTGDGSALLPSIMLYGWGKNEPLSPTTSPYVQFALNTSQYSGVQMQFNSLRKSNGPDNFEIYRSTDGTSWTPVASFTDTGTAWTPFGPFSVSGATTEPITYFRILGNHANSGGKGVNINLDDITFTGCKVPVPPTLSKTFETNPVAVGAASRLTFTMTNPNDIPLSGISFEDVLPEGLEVDASPNVATTCTAGGISSTTGGSLTGGENALLFSGGALTNYGSCTASVNVRATTPGPHQNVSGMITSAQSGANNTASGFGSANLNAVAPPEISKRFAPTSILTGSVSTLSFTIHNPNPYDPLSGLAFSDTYPAGLVNASAPSVTNTCGGSVSAAAGGSTISLTNGGTLDSGASCTVTVNVTSNTAGTYLNTSGNVSSVINGAAVYGNAASATLVVRDVRPQISIQKQIGTSASGPWETATAVSAGQQVWYRFTVENTGDVPLGSIQVVDDHFSTNSCAWSNPVNPLPAPVASNDNHLSTCVIGPVTAAAGTLVNTAYAQATYNGVVYTSNTDSATYGTASLAMTKSVTEPNYAAGDLLHYQFVVTNSGFAPLAAPVSINDALTASETCPDLTTVGDGDSWLDPGESITCTGLYTATAADVAAGSITNTASAIVDGVASSASSVTIYPAPDLTAALTNDTGGTLVFGGSFQWTVQVDNSTGGPNTASFASGEVILRDMLPSGAAYGGSVTVTNGTTPPGGTGTIVCTIADQTLTCVASGGAVTLAPGASFQAAFEVTPSLVGVLSNSGSACQADPDGQVHETAEDNNTCSDAITVSAAAPGIGKAFAPSSIATGQVSELTLTITNPNPNEPLTGVAFTDTYPANLVNASPLQTTNSCGGTLTASAGGGSISLTGGVIAGGASCSVTVSVTASTLGLYTNTTGQVSSTNGGTGNTATSQLLVTRPTAVTLYDFSVVAAKPFLRLNWSTATEVDNLGFNLYRRPIAGGEFVKVNPALIISQSPGQLLGADYTWLDETATATEGYLYRLEALDVDGSIQHYEVVYQLDRSLLSDGPPYQVLLPLIQCSR